MSAFEITDRPRGGNLPAGRFLLRFSWMVLAAAVPALVGAQEKKLPPAAEKTVDYTRDIEPIITKNCIKCHGENKPKSQFRLDGRETALKGGEIGVDIIPGKSAESPLILFVAGLDEDTRMPPKGDMLTPEEVGLLRAWIDQGVKWAEAPPPPAPVRSDIAGIDGAKSRVTSVAFSPGGDVIASGGGDTLIFRPGEVKLWDLASGKERASFQGHESTVWSVAFDREGKTLASASYDKIVKLWDLSTSKERATLKGHANWITSVAFSPDGTLVATGSEDATVKLWKAESGEEVATLKGHGATVRCVAFSKDGTRLATGSFDKTVKIWDVAGKAEVETLSGHADSVWSVSFSIEPDTLASGSADGSVKLWKIGKGGEKSSEKRTLQAHGNWVACVAFSPDGKRLATSGFDRAVKLFEVGSGAELDALTGLGAMVWSVAFSPDGKRLALGLSAGLEGEKTLKVWTLPAEGWRAF